MLFASASSHMCLSLLKTHLRKPRTAIALLLTALLAVAGYIVQNKNAADANKVQHEVVQEAAEREKGEAKAFKQLERVQVRGMLRILGVLGD